MISAEDVTLALTVSVAMICSAVTAIPVITVPTTYVPAETVAMPVRWSALNVVNIVTTAMTISVADAIPVRNAGKTTAGAITVTSAVIV